jgi:hypothetical protein
MYTNIKTEPALAELSEYLHEKRNEFSYPCEALIKALDLVFRNNTSNSVTSTASKSPARQWAHLRLLHTPQLPMADTKKKCCHIGPST